jgi:tetratricopeptide (TPR) repeat protein
MKAARAAVLGDVWGRATTMAIVVGSLSGCLGPSDVTRLAGGELRVGPAVSMRAYEAFLQGAIAEEQGDFARAERGYLAAIAAGPKEAEPWARLGTVTCTRSPKRADDAFERALGFDPELESALERRAACMKLRGLPADFGPAFRQKPHRVETAARALVEGGGSSAGDAALALTVAYAEVPAAWDALAAYAAARGDTRTEVRALAERARKDAPGRTRALARVCGLEDAGFVAYARELAAAAVDARPAVGPASGSAGREADCRDARVLALDEALARGDVAAARRRAVRTHVGLEEAASRALAMGERALARELARAVAESSPDSAAAHIVLAMTDPGPEVAARLRGLPRASRPLPAALAVVVAEALLAHAGRDAARAWLTAVPVEPVSGRDSLLLSRVVELVVARIASEGMLPPEGRAELAVREGRRGECGVGGVGARRAEPEAPLDGPHAYLCAAWGAPRSGATRALRARLAPEHPVVVVADVLVGLAEASPTSTGPGAAVVVGPAGALGDAALSGRVAEAGHGALVLAARVQLARARRDADGAARAARLLASAPRALTDHEKSLSQDKL